MGPTKRLLLVLSLLIVMALPLPVSAQVIQVPSAGSVVAGSSAIFATVDPSLTTDCATGNVKLGWVYYNNDPTLDNPRKFVCLENDQGEPRWVLDASSLQESYEIGSHGFVDVPVEAPLVFQPQQETGGSKEERWGESNQLVTSRTDSLGNPLAPDVVRLRKNHAYDVYTETDDDPLTLSLIMSVENANNVTTVQWLDSNGNVVLRWPVAGNVLTLRDERERSTVLEEVAAADDNMPFGDFLRASTIQSVWCRCSDVTGTLPTFTLSDGAGNAMTITDTNPVCTSYSAARSAKTVTANNSLVAGEMLLFHTTNTPTAGKTCQISVSYTLD